MQRLQQQFTRGRALIAIGTLLLAFSGALYAQREFRTYPPLEGTESNSALPPDYQLPANFVLGRLMYPAAGGDGDWKAGNSSWTIDYPLGDRKFSRLLRRLTTIDVRAVEQPVDLDDGEDVFDWPFLVASNVGSWDLTESQAAKLRDYLLRGGFLLCDSFFGSREWQGFERTLRKVFPDRPIQELADNDPIFTPFYDLSKRQQVRNMRSIRRNGLNGGYRADGATPHWRAILDDEGRVMVMITFNNDLGDSWQYADDPQYPQEDSNLGIRLAVNFALYDLTH